MVSHGQPLSVGRAVKRFGEWPPRALREWGIQVAPWRNTVKNLKSKKQGYEALYIELQRGLRKGQYSSPSLVYDSVLCLCLSDSTHLQLISGLWSNKEGRDIFFIKKCYGLIIASSSFITIYIYIYIYNIATSW